MGNLGYKAFYRRQLPHIQPHGATIFVTFRLAGSIPREVLVRWSREYLELERILATLEQPEIDERKNEFTRRRFRELDDCLDRAETGPHWLKDDRIAQLVVDGLRYLDDRVYRLDAFCVMSNHVHAVFAPLLLSTENNEYHSLSVIMHSLKRHTAREANRLLKRTGTFWEHESYDHYVRDQAEWERIVNYVINNPVKAGLIENWSKWPYSYRRA
jgi:REP element-mobilizing transposase RayT